MKNLDADTTLMQSLAVEDMLRRLFLQPLNSENLDEILELTGNFAEEFKRHDFVLELEKCKNDKKILDETRYEFNTLFVGPKRPKALPYESTYFDYKTLFGNKTMQVREFYETSGLKVENDKLDKIPDDFIGFELQYLYVMSFNAIKFLGKSEFADIIQQKQNFITQHPSKWFDKFTERIMASAILPIWQSFSEFLNLYLEKESTNLKNLIKN